MEDTEFEASTAPEALFSFSPFCRSHLRSATYCTLARIFSHCDDDSELCQVIRPENIYQNSAVQRSKMDGESFGDDSILQKEFYESPKVMHELAQTMVIETNEKAVVDDGCLQIGLQDKFINEEMLIQKLDDIMKGDEIRVHDYMKTSCSLKQIHGGNINVVCPVEEHPVCPQVVEESRNVGQNVPTNLFSLNEHATEKITNFEKGLQHIRISNEGSSMRKFPEVKPKDMNFETVVSSAKNEKGIHAGVFNFSPVEKEEKHGQYVSNAPVLLLDENLTCRTLDKYENHFCEGKMISPNDEVESGEVEEGEIFGNFGINDDLAETLSEDFEVLQKKVDDVQMAADTMDGRVFLSTHAFGESSSNGRELKDGQFDENIMSFHPRIVVQGKLMIGKKVEENDFGLEEGSKQKDFGGTVGVDYEEACLDNLVLQAEISMTNKTGSTSTQKSDRDVCDKKKRIPSKERTEKRKQNKRKKRAEKNRELGVKRLKIHPLIKQKPVAHCRHYLRGRCQEGEKCKFSHDTVPLTKSKPCCHFARHSCMKGDDCPYDHQLSKYPCSNFTAKGSCSRGAACMFSHKMPLKEDSKSTSNPVAELKSPSLVISDPKKQLDNAGISKPNSNFLSNSLGSYFHKDTIQNVTQNSQEKTSQTPIGINFLSFGNSSSCHSSTVKSCSSSLKVNDTGPNDLGMIKSPMRTATGWVPKGMSFVSFNRAPEDSDSSKLLTLSSDSSCGGKLVQQNVEEPKRMNLISFGKSYPNDYHDQRHPKNGIESTSLDINTLSDKHQNLSLSSSRLLHTPLSSGQPSADSFTSRIYKGTTNSAQKALLSTFAFAAKCESLMKFFCGYDGPSLHLDRFHNDELLSNLNRSSEFTAPSSRRSHILEAYFGKYPTLNVKHKVHRQT